MPNILKLQKELESIPDERLIAEVSAPNMYPAYLSAQELQRRQDFRNATMQRMVEEGTIIDQRIMEAQGMPGTDFAGQAQQTADAALQGIGSIPNLQPTQPMPAAMVGAQDPSMMQDPSMTQGQLPMGAMVEGGLVGYQNGGSTDDPKLDWKNESLRTPEGDYASGERSLLGDVYRLGKRAYANLGGVGNVIGANLAEMYEAALPNRQFPEERRTEDGRLMLGRGPIWNRKYYDPEIEGISGLKEVVGELPGATPIEPSMSYEELFGPSDASSADQGPDLSTYEDMVGRTDASDLVQRIYDERDRQSRPSPQDLQFMGLREQAADRDMERYERLAAQDRARMDSLRARQARFDENEQGYQDELAAERQAARDRAEGDQMSELARIVGGSISRGRFQEGGIGGGISEGITDLRDLQERQRAEDRRVRDEIRDIGLRRFEAESTAEERLLQIERDIISGRITAEQGSDEARLLNAQLVSERSNAQLDTNAIVQAHQIESSERQTMATIAAEMQMQETSRRMDDETAAAVSQTAATTIDTAMQNTTNVSDLVNSIRRELEFKYQYLPEESRQSVIESAIRAALTRVRDTGSRQLRDDLRRIMEQGEGGAIPGSADGGFMEQGLGTLIPRP